MYKLLYVVPKISQTATGANYNVHVYTLIHRNIEIRSTLYISYRTYSTFKIAI